MVFIKGFYVKILVIMDKLYFLICYLYGFVKIDYINKYFYN